MYENNFGKSHCRLVNIIRGEVCEPIYQTSIANYSFQYLHDF